MLRGQCYEVNDSVECLVCKETPVIVWKWFQDPGTHSKILSPKETGDILLGMDPIDVSVSVGFGIGAILLNECKSNRNYFGSPNFVLYTILYIVPSWIRHLRFKNFDVCIRSIFAIHK